MMFLIRIRKSLFKTKLYNENFSKMTRFSALNKSTEKSIHNGSYFDEILNADKEYNDIAERLIRVGEAHRCIVIQPYIKWGPRKVKISPDEQLEEAVALINTLPAWTVQDTVTVPLDTLERKTIFKSGTMERLAKLVRQSGVTAVFLNMGNLKPIQTKLLEENFRLPILDRYNIVMQILKIHAASKHAKLQVAMAELHYLRRKMQKDVIIFAHNPEDLKLMFQNREQKLKMAINELRNQRGLLRSKRQKMNYPVVAVIGYTNAGKTYLIKALTGEEQLQPKNQLFATLDVTLHSGILPSGLEVLYVDTVGFISDIPTNLIECFVATLEDAVLADIILHVEDVSSSCYDYKRKHVLATLKDLGLKTGIPDILDKVISVGNKCDLIKDTSKLDVMPISAKADFGIEDLRFKLESTLLDATSRKKITIKVPNGGEEIRWLYKNATVVSEIPDENDQQLVQAQVIIHNSKLEQFKHYFIK